MEHNTNDSKTSLGHKLSSKTVFRSICVLIVLMLIIFGYSAVPFDQGDSLYIKVLRKAVPSPAENRRRLKALRNHPTYVANIAAGLNQSSPKIKGHEVQLEDNERINGYQRKYIDRNSIMSKNDTKLNEIKIVLTIAYMRTGSTLTGAILQSYPGTFYVFEPIRKVNDFFRGIESSKKKGILRFVNGTHRNVSTGERINIILDEINSWLCCNLTSLSVNAINNMHHSQHTNIMRELMHCMKEEEKKEEPVVERCFDQAIRMCQKAPLRIIKFIRLKMKDAAKLLPRYPNMKIIHLLRDPRGIMSSRFQIGAASKAKIEFEANKHCNTVTNDLTVSKDILSRFPGRLKIVLYEDLAERPLETSKDIFTFLGMPFPDFVQTFIKNQTNADHNSGHFDTQRKDSSFTANNWRNRIKAGVSNVVYKACLKSNKLLGYLPLWSDERLKNRRIASRNGTDVTKELLKNELW